MAVNARIVTIANTPTRIDSVTDKPGQGGLIQNPGGVAVYLGGPTVTTGAGYILGPGESASIDLSPDDALYGIVAAGTSDIRVLEVGV